MLTNFARSRNRFSWRTLELLNRNPLDIVERNFSRFVVVNSFLRMGTSGLPPDSEAAQLARVEPSVLTWEQPEPV